MITRPSEDRNARRCTRNSTALPRSSVRYDAMRAGYATPGQHSKSASSRHHVPTPGTSTTRPHHHTLRTPKMPDEELRKADRWDGRVSGRRTVIFNPCPSLASRTCAGRHSRPLAPPVAEVVRLAVGIGVLGEDRDLTACRLDVVRQQANDPATEDRGRGYPQGNSALHSRRLPTHCHRYQSSPPFPRALRM